MQNLHQTDCKSLLLFCFVFLLFGTPLKTKWCISGALNILKLLQLLTASCATPEGLAVQLGISLFTRQQRIKRRKKKRHLHILHDVY